MLSDFSLDRAVARVRVFIGLLTLIGFAVLLVAKDATWAVSFLGGAVVSALSFHVMHRFVMAIGPGGVTKPSTFRIVLLGARYLLIGAVVYGMMRLFGLHLLAALCGLLVTAAATFLEVLYELIHGT